MQIIYRKQIPGKPPTESRFEGWVGALIGLAVLVGAAILFVFFIPIVLIGVLGFIGLILFLILAGWIWMATRIGFREMWNVTTLLLGAESRGMRDVGA